MLIKSKLPFEVLGKIWQLSDIDQDGNLDVDEFAVAMYLCHQAMAGTTIEDRLPSNLIPPSKRQPAPAFSVSPFDVSAPFDS